MKFHCAQLILLIALVLLLTGRFVESISKFENVLPGQNSLPKIRSDTIKDEYGKDGINKGASSFRNHWYFQSGSSVATEKSTRETYSYSSGSRKYTNPIFSKVLIKRSAFSPNEQSGNRSHPAVQTSYTETNTNNFTRIKLLFSSNVNSNFSALNNDRNAVVKNLESVFTSANKSIRWFSIDLANQRSTNRSGLQTSISSFERNTSQDFLIDLQQNRSYEDLCHELYNENGCMLSAVVIDLRNLFHVLDTNGTILNSPKVVPNDLGNFSDATLQNLTQNFNCVVEDIFSLNIFCTNVLDFYSIGEYLPNDTVILDLSFGFQIKLLKPLFPHLKSLKSLTLSNNHHRYITRAFMGLDNLESLDLSNNDIIALIKAFSFIPKLKVLDLSGNQFRRLQTPSDAVSYLNDLQNLTLNHNYHINYITIRDLLGLNNCKIAVFALYNTTIEYVERGAFNSMPNLKVLEISVNYMNENALANITCGMAETIETVFFRMMLNIKSFPYDAVYCLRKSKLRDLHLGNNYIKTVPALPSLPNLRFFSMSNSSLESIEIEAFQNVTGLEIINLRSNKLGSFPIALSFVKSLKKLYIDSQIQEFEYQRFIIKDYIFQNLTRLHTLRLSLLHLNHLSRYCLYGLRNLKIAFLSLAGLYNIEDFAFETLISLTILDLKGNGISSISNFTFFGLRNLEQLYLNSNSIKMFSPVYPFQYSPFIRVILLQSNGVRTIPQGMFSNLEELQILTLGKNKIIPWEERIFHPNASLKILGLSENNIDYISDTMLAEFHQVTVNLDLSKNPFNCSKCGMKEFQTFFQNSNLSFQLPLPETKDSIYICVNPESMQNKTFSEVELSEILCLLTESEILSLLAIVLMSSFLIIAVLVSSLCYGFRWYIRYWIFHFRTTFAVKKGSFRKKNYTFDAFIIYSAIDTPWVEDHLIPALEEQEPRYKICVHQRDFQVGKQITENILEAIENSHKVILILTEGFIKSEWCMYELHLAQHKLFDDTRDILILVKLRTIDKKLYTKNVSYIERTRKCYMWTDSQIGRKLFWEQIRKHLGPPRSSQTFLQL